MDAGRDAMARLPMFGSRAEAAFNEWRMEDVRESFKRYAVCLYCAIVCAIRTLNQSKDSG